MYTLPLVWLARIRARGRSEGRPEPSSQARKEPPPTPAKVPATGPGVSVGGTGGGEAGGQGERKSPLGGPTSPPPRPAPGQVKRGPGSAPGGGAATGVGKGNNSTFIWDCLALSGWAEEEAADGAAGEGVVSGIWLHTCSCLTLCVLGLGARRGRAARLRGTRPRPRSARWPGRPASGIPRPAGRSRGAREWGSLAGPWGCPVPLAVPLDLHWPLRHSPRLRSLPPARPRGSGGRGKARGGSRASARIPRRPPAIPGSRPSGGGAAATAMPRARGAGQAQRAAAGRGN